MSQEYFYVFHEGEETGPFTLDQIVDKVKSNELTPIDYLYDENKGDWVLLMEHQDLMQQLKDLKPNQPPKPHKEESQQEQQEQTAASPAEQDKSRDNHMATEWYVLKGDNRFGPFAFVDVIKMLQQKVIFEFDFAWRPGLEAWKRISELEEFDNKEIEKLKDTLMPEIEQVFFRRRHRRVKYNATILVHDNHQVWKGQSVEVSSGGAGVVIENSMIVPGQLLYMHFKPGDSMPPFNAICEVVSKKYDENANEKNSPIEYGLKFTKISPNAQKTLEEFAKTGEAA